jgi:phosphonoacetaldehyde hydrolase
MSDASQQTSPSAAAARRPYRGPLKAVIFDWAGTVVDYGSRAPVLAVMQAFSAHDVPISVVEARGPMGMAKRDHLREVLAVPRVRDQWRKVHGQTPDEATIDRIYSGFLAMQARMLVDYAQLIPGCLEAVEHCRRAGMKIGSSTGYTRELMDVLEPVVHRLGFQPDAMVCTTDVPAGRPAPWMCLENARRLDVYPMEAIVKVDDTIVGVEAGLNAGMWTIGVARSGNLVGLSEDELGALSPGEQASRVAAAYERLYAGGAHLVIDTVADLPAALDALSRRLGQGAAPQSTARA